MTPHGEHGVTGRSPERIEADIEARRRRLAETLDEIAVRTHPSTLTAKAKEEAAQAVDRTVGKAVAKANGAVARVSEKVRKEFFDGYGSPRLERVVPVAVAAAAVVGFAVWRSARSSRPSSARSARSAKKKR
ncbi:DUF3618 domain-containing protein [Mangrovactinospora gilvigrisea]|uniref:DUF3618 domain-containing protein n=1 Tax=Mangrovactinospora gilvigrisea TaxID=1428644 RepID=UPI003AF3FFAF